MNLYQKRNYRQCCDKGDTNKMFDYIFDYFKAKKAAEIYYESQKKSEETLNDILFKDGETPLYFSKTHYNLLLDTFNIKQKVSSSHERDSVMRNNASMKGKIGNDVTSIESEIFSSEELGVKDWESYDKSSEISTIKDNLEKIKEEGKKITEVNKKGYFYTRFPVFHGRIAEFRPENIIKSAYIWYGLYRDIELYLCGSANNVFQVDKEKYPEALWAPSSIEGPKNIFNKLVSEIVENDNDISEELTEGKSIFEILCDNIKDTVMNRYKAESFLQWQDMIVFCTAFEEKDGIKRIFGVPILVIPSSGYGYGWYNLNHESRYEKGSNNEYNPNDKTRYYEFDNDKFTGRYLDKIDDNSILATACKKLEEVDANSAYAMYSFETKKSRNIPDRSKVKKCDDIIGLCMEKYLFKK